MATVEVRPFEAEHAPGGSAGRIDRDGYTFDTGPTVLTMRGLLDDVVSAAGAKMEDVAKITCFITDIAHYPAYSKVRAETWPKDPPASSTVVVAGLVRPELLVEVEAIVRLP